MLLKFTHDVYSVYKSRLNLLVSTYVRDYCDAQAGFLAEFWSKILQFTPYSEIPPPLWKTSDLG